MRNPDCFQARERPILFRGEMVRAILDGRKTQTRRVVNSKYWPVDLSPGFMWEFDPPKDRSDEWYIGCANQNTGERVGFGPICCPYGRPGDLLWVRETWKYVDWTEDGDPKISFAAGGDFWPSPSKIDECRWTERLQDIWAELSAAENYGIDGRASDRKWRPSVHMPRWASRITLRVTDVRVQRLQEISAWDACCEGIQPVPYEFEAFPGYIEGFARLWDSINAKRGYPWASNPWVWAITFERRRCDPAT